MRASLQFGAIHADLAHLTDITLQDVPNREYALRLFVENEEIELQKTANRSWTPAKRQYVLSGLLTEHTLIGIRMQGYLINTRDVRGDPKEDRPFLLGEDSTE